MNSIFDKDNKYLFNRLYLKVKDSKEKIILSQNIINVINKLLTYNFDSSKITINIIDYNDIDSKIDIVKFIPDRIKQILKNNTVNKCVNIQSKEFPINIRIFFTNEIKNFSEKKIIYIAKICSYMYNYKLFDNKEYNEELNIYLIPSSFKKKFPDKCSFDVENINSGVTITNLENNKLSYILLWRTEEMIKVLIHELIHFLKLDFSDVTRQKNTKKYDNIIISLLNRNLKNYKIHDLLLNESLTETMAIFFHSIFLSFHINKKNCIKLTSKILNLELYFSLIQCSKIIKKINSNNYCEEKTSLSSYFFIKTLFLLSFDDWIFCKKNYNNYKNLVIFTLFLINKKFDILKENLSSSDHDTLRMSILGLSL